MTFAVVSTSGSKCKLAANLLKSNQGTCRVPALLKGYTMPTCVHCIEHNCDATRGQHLIGVCMQFYFKTGVQLPCCSAPPCKARAVLARLASCHKKQERPVTKAEKALWQQSQQRYQQAAYAYQVQGRLGRKGQPVIQKPSFQPKPDCAQMRPCLLP